MNARTGTPSRGRVAVLLPLRRGGSVRSGFDSIVQGLARHGVTADPYDFSTSPQAKVAALVATRYDAVLVLAGSTLVSGPPAWTTDILDMIEAPLLLRLADPPSASKYFRAINCVRHRIHLSGRDMMVADYFEAGNDGPLPVSYAPGRYSRDRLPLADAEMPVAGRDIPFLFVGSIPDGAGIESHVRRLMPGRMDCLMTLSAQLLSNTQRAVWRVAGAVFDGLGLPLSPFHGQGRLLLELANA